MEIVKISVVARAWGGMYEEAEHRAVFQEVELFSIIL